MFWRCRRPSYRYVRGDLVIEFERDGERCAVAVPEDEAAALVAGAKRGDNLTWSRLEGLWQAQKAQYEAWKRGQDAARRREVQ